MQLQQNRPGILCGSCASGLDQPYSQHFTMCKMFQLGSAYGGVDIGDNILILGAVLKGEAPGKGDRAEGYLDWLGLGLCMTV